MNIKLFSILILSVIAFSVLLIHPSPPAKAGNDQNLRQKAQKLFKDGNYKDAHDVFEKLCLDAATDPKKVGEDLNMAVQCLANLNRVNEADALREKSIEIHQDNWRLLLAAAQSYANFQHYGFIVAGEFERGHHRGGGRYVNAFERDRVRALQLMSDARRLCEKAPEGSETANFYIIFADMLAQQRGYGGAWRMQYLTDLSELPDYDEGHYYGGSDTRGAPVDKAGKPVFHIVPESWDAAESDGQRWRWLLMMAEKTDPGYRHTALNRLAAFQYNQFGVQTIASVFQPRADEDSADKTGTFALHTLAETETIARLAIGARRFDLPDEFNFIRMYQELKDYRTLAQIFENRRQYPKAAYYWEKAKEKDRVAQITGNWGVFEPVMTQPAEKGATVDFRFRNGDSVTFEAYPIDIPRLLEDLKDYIRSNPRKLDWRHVNPAQIGYRIVRENEKKYLGKRTAEWSMNLEPRPSHFDRRITVTTPLQKAGAYLLKAEMENGNTSRIIIWIDDTSLVKKTLDRGMLYFVADAVTGRAVPDANVEFFGYRIEAAGNLFGPKYEISNFAEYTDKNGLVTIGKGGKGGDGPNRMSDRMQWLITATTDSGRLAFLGFTHVWYAYHYDQEYNETKTLAITDRPVYRPDQDVKFKCWVRHAKYDQETASDFAGNMFPVRLWNPRNEKVFDENIRADEFGGISGQYHLPAEAALGVWRIEIVNYGGGQFRVEEYKKPEFEVTVEAPEKPVMLGETVTAKVSAKYYFGAPVTHAKVKYKVLRHAHDAVWYPAGPWDWLYGSGYGWLAQDYAWYPGWSSWGCRRPIPWWWHRPAPPPELLMENETEIGPDGVVEIPIDTSLAKELHGDTDHRYEITAEVTDLSRRVIVGTGSVMAARHPFKVYAWTDRGYYRTGDTIRAQFSARTPDGKPVSGKAKVRLLAVSYDEENRPVETEMGDWSLSFGEDGRGALQMVAARAGQYRVSCTVDDGAGHEMEGGYLFVVRGQGFDGGDFRFNALELIPDKSEYAPGETVRLMINTDRPGATVLLFVRPSNGVYLLPKVISMKGKSVVEEITVSKKDMPNFFVEGLTIAGGRVHTQNCEIAVPPEKRVLNLTVTPSAERYKPGGPATVQVKLTDFSGEPYEGSVVMTAYDKAVEYISGGSNVPEIKAFFWKWRRRHSPQTEASLGRMFQNLLKDKEIPMRSLGVFGHLVADELGAYDDRDVVFKSQSARGMRKKDAVMAPSAPAPMAQARGDAAMVMEDKAEANVAGREMEMTPDQAAPVEPQIRSQFADTAFWAEAVTTDAQGLATVTFDMPENLTGWKIRAWAMGHGTRVGEAVAEVVTAKDLMVRLQAPRFFVEKDEVVLSANIHNYLEAPKSVKAVIELDGPALELLEDAARTVTVDPEGETRVDWRVKAVKEGEAVVRVKALTDEESDAMEMRFPVYVHGMDKMVPFCGVIRPEQENAALTLDVPAERRPEASRLEIRYTPTLAGAMVDALPYLADYPYGCTEQTLNRFVPTVITLNVLKKLGLDLEDIREKQTNLNAQEIGDDAERAKQWKRFPRNPVFDEAEVLKMVKTGVQRLTNMQLSDGGWGWFSGWGEHSWPHTTAVVVRGLQTARRNGAAVVPSVLNRGIGWLRRYQSEQVQRIRNGRPEKKKNPWKAHADNMDAMIYMILADAEIEDAQMREYLYEDRNQLSVYGKAMFGLALETQGHKEKLAMILKNIRQYLVTDDENQTAWLNMGNGGYWWYWYGSEIEAHSYYVKLLCRVDPKGETASRLVKYLLNNRKHSTYWNSTRDTALCIEAFADYLAATDEGRPDMTVEIWVDGAMKKSVRITPETLFAFDNKLVMEGPDVTTGRHKVELRKKGKGPLYFNAYLSYFTLEDYIKKAGLEIKVDRRYYRLREVEKTVKVSGSRGQALDQRVEKYERLPLEDLSLLKSGELVEVELVIESKNDYEYIIFEDMKAAGFEPVSIRSGYVSEGPGAYLELRDEKAAFFVRVLPRGKHSMAYRLRAEIPGKFSALPTKAYGMYAPELRANSDEMKLRIGD